MNNFIRVGVSLVLALTMGAQGVLAATSSDLRQTWLQAQQTRIADEAAGREAQVAYQKNKTPENDAKVVETAKATMNAALDEVEAWLKWKDEEAQTDPRVPSEIKTSISNDVAANIVKINGYRSDVAGVKTQAQAVVVFLKLINGYAGLLADVARNTGSMWVAIGNAWVTNAETYEAKLRSAAQEMANNGEAIADLDAATSALTAARTNVTSAGESYTKVKIPGTPFISFAQGNAYLRVAQTKVLEAQAQMLKALQLINAQVK